jgi:poly(A)-specific ribonuclease
MEVPFREGVPYLSRQEEARVRDTAIKGMDKSKIADIEIKSSDLDALTFVKSLRGKIMAWKAIPAVSLLLHLVLTY